MHCIVKSSQPTKGNVFATLQASVDIKNPFDILNSFVKFIYSEKATKFCKIFTILLFVCTVDKSKVKNIKTLKVTSLEPVSFEKIVHFDSIGTILW